MELNTVARPFKRRLFGGFDARDVMHYIEELAAQRNKYKASGERLQAELRSLNAEIRRLRAELEEAERRVQDIRLGALDEADRSVLSLGESYSRIRTDVESAADAIRSELERLTAALDDLVDTLDRTGQCFSEIRAHIEDEKALAAARSAGAET